nr:hypothetical protein CFP56_78832 [Quercus suber]
MDDWVEDRQIKPQRLKLDLPFKRKLHLDVLPRLPDRSSSVPHLAIVPDGVMPQVFHLYDSVSVSLLFI